MRDPWEKLENNTIRALGVLWIALGLLNLHAPGAATAFFTFGAACFFASIFRD